jgi:hypothetical protein
MNYATKQKKITFKMTIYVVDLLLYVVSYCNIGCYGFLAIHAVDSDPHIRLIRVRYERRREKMFYFKIVKKRLFPNNFSDSTLQKPAISI